jgi:hypothetical protein
MKIECVHAVAKAIGRDLTKAEQQGMDDRVRATMRRLASREPERWRTMPQAERLRETGRVIADDLAHEADLRQTRAAQQIEAHDRHIPDIEAAGVKGYDAIQRKLHQLDRYIKGVHGELQREAFDFIDYATRNDQGSLGGRGVRWLANLSDPEKARAFAREVFGQDGGDAGAKAAAQAWRQVADTIRERFNRAGGDIRRLSTAYLPTMHDAGLVRKAGIERWVTATLRQLDRSRYTDEHGRPYTDAELGKVLEQAYRDITTDGLASSELGALRGESAIANAGSQHRALHFKDGDAYATYHAEFGMGSAFDAVTTHLRTMARNIALVEELGPNPQATFRTMSDVAKMAGGNDRFGGLYTTEDGWNTLRGAFDNPQSQRAARIGSIVRDIEVVGKLQQTLLGSVTDIPLYMITLGFNRLPFWQGMTNLVRAYGPDMKRFANVAGLMGDGLIADMNTAGDTLIGSGWTRGAANATMKATLLQEMTNATRRALSVTMMNGMATIARTPWEALNRDDRARLATAGWRADEWDALQHVTPEDWRGAKMLTPAAVMRTESIDKPMRERIVSRLLGIIVDESEYASPNPDLRTRTVTAGTLQRGTGKGELWRSLMLFKGYPLSMLFRHLDRVFNGDMSPASRVAYGAGLTFGTTLFGALSLELYDLAAGRDPRDMTGDGGEDPAALLKFWGAAVAKGGGLGFLGDMLLNGVGAQGQSGASAAIGGVVGPVAGSAFELGYDVLLENLKQAAAGEQTHAGAETFRWARGHAPFVNLWYGKLALDQAVLNQAQEFLSPGYLDKTRARMERQWGSTYWWDPQNTGLLAEDGMQGPERAPELATAIGGR